MKTTIDAIQLYMNKGNFDISLLIIDQLSRESELSEEIQNFKVECLYSLHRFLEAHELASKYAEDGNETQTLTFLRGLICYSLELYEEAITHFRTNKQWIRWVTKAKLMNQIAKNESQPITFNQPQQSTRTVEFIWSQTEAEVVLLITIPSILSNQIKVQSYPKSLDISISNGLKVVHSLSFELDKEIIPRSTTFNVHPDKIEFVMQKANPGDMWVLDKHPKELQDLDQTAAPPTMNTLLSELDSILDITDGDAIKSFENMSLTAIEESSTSTDDEYSDQIPEPPSDEVRIP